MKVNLWTALWCLVGLVAIGLFIGYRRLVKSLGKPDQILPLWEYIAELHVLGFFADRLYTMLIKVINPYSRSIGTLSVNEFRLTPDFRITSLEVGRFSGRLDRRRMSDGPFRCTHGVALTLFAETLAGLAVFSRLLKGGNGILLKSETEYIKKAKGIARITASWDLIERYDYGVCGIRSRRERTC
jgi:acyl-coenzyme A thioesterase PaaI-like protein